jgi:hypothetical protein
MTEVDTGTRATRTAAPGTLARGAVATLLALAAPAVSFLPALTTNIHGSAHWGTSPRRGPGKAGHVPACNQPLRMFNVVRLR